MVSARDSPQGSSLWTIAFGETNRSQSDRINSRSAGLARNRAAAWAVSFTRIRRVKRRAKAVAGTNFAARRWGAWFAKVDWMCEGNVLDSDRREFRIVGGTTCNANGERIRVISWS
jgi:hypothetical protein